MLRNVAGKQKVHIRSCSRKTCDCPKRLVAGTVDSDSDSLIVSAVS